MLTNNLEEKISTVSEEKLKALQERGRAILEARRKNAQPTLYTSMSASIQQEQPNTQQEQLQPSKLQTLPSEQTGLESSSLSKQALSNLTHVNELHAAKPTPTTTTPLVNAKHQESNAMQESTLSSVDMIPKAEVEQMRTELVDKFNEHLAKCESDNKLYWEQVAATHAEDIAAIETERDEYKALCEQLKTKQLETVTESTQTIDQLNEENTKILKELEEAKTVNTELLAEIARAKRELQEQNIELEDARTKLLMLTQTQIDKSFANLINDEASERKVEELSLELQITTTMNELEKQIINMTNSKSEDMEKNLQKRIDELQIELQQITLTLDESESIRKILEEDAAELQHNVDEEQATNHKLQEEIGDLRSLLHEAEQIITSNVHNINTTTIHGDNVDQAVNEFNPFYENTNEFDTINEEQGTEDRNNDVDVDHHHHHHHRLNDNINALNNEEQVKLVKYETVSNPFADDDDDDNEGNNDDNIVFATINESGAMHADTMHVNDKGNDNIDEHNSIGSNQKEEENVVFAELQNEANNENNNGVDKFDIEEKQMLYREIEMLRSELEESMQQLQIANDEVQRLNEELYCACNTNKELTEQQQEEEEHKEVMVDAVCEEIANTQNTCTLPQINSIDMQQGHINVNDNIIDDEITDEKDNVNGHIVPVAKESVYELPESTNYNDDQAVSADNPFLDEDDTQVLPLQTNKVIEAGEGALESDELTWKQSRIDFLENELESVLAQHEEEMQALADEAADRMIELKQDYENEINELKLLVKRLQHEQEVEETQQVEVGEPEYAENVEANNIVNEEAEDGLAANHKIENEVNEQVAELTSQNEQLTVEINELHQQLQALHDEHTLEIENLLAENEECQRKHEVDMEQLLQEQETKYKELLERELAEVVDKADYLQLEEEALEVQDKYVALLHEYEILENIQRTICTVKDSVDNAPDQTGIFDNNNNNNNNNNTEDDNNRYLAHHEEQDDDGTSIVTDKDKSNNDGNDNVVQQETHTQEEMWHMEKAKLERELCEVKEQLEALKEKEQEQEKEEYDNNYKMQVVKAKDHEAAERRIKELQEHNDELEELVRVGAIKIESALEEQNRQQMKLEEELCKKQQETKTLQLHIAHLQEELQNAETTTTENLLAMKRNEEETTLHEMNDLQEQMTLLQTQLQDQRTKTGMAERAMREKVLLYDELVKEKTRLLQRHEAETLALRNELLTIRSELHSLQSHAATFPVTEEHYKLEIAELTERLKEQNAEYKSLHEELSECKRVITEHEKLEKQEEEKIKQQQNEATAHERVKQEERRKEGSRNENTQHNETPWSTCEGQIDRLLERNSNLEEQIKELHTTHNNLLDEYSALQVELLQARRGIELKEQTLKRSESELRHCRAQLSHYAESMTTKSNQLQSVEMELEEYKHHRSELLDEIDTISRRLLFQEEMYEQSSYCELLWEEKVYSVASHLDEWITAVYGGYELLQTTLAAQHKTILTKCDAIESAAAQALTEGEAQIAEYELALESAAQEQREMHDIITDLTAQLAQCKNKEAAQHEELNDVQRQMEDAMQYHKKEMKELKKLLSETESKYENEAHACLLAKEEMEHMRHQAEMSASAWHVQHDELNRQIQLLQTQIASQQDNVSTLKENEWATQSKLQRELSSALDERTRAMASAQSLQAQLDKLLPRLQEMETHEAQRSAQLMDLKQSLSLTSIELAKEKSAHSREVSSLQELLEQHKQDLHTLQEDHITLSTLRDKFSAQASELALKLSSAHAQLASQEQIIEQLRESLSEAQSVINRQTSESELRQSTTERELKHFEHMYVASKTQVEELNAQLAALQCECAAAQDALKRTHIDFTQREEQYKREQTQLQRENERLVHKVETLETQNDSHRSARLSAEEKLHSTLEKLHQVEEELHESHAHMSNMNTILTQRTSTYSAEVEEMKAALNRAQVEVAESRKLLSAAEVQQVEKDGMLFRIKGELTAVRNELAQCQSTIIKLEERREAAELRARECIHTQEEEHQEHHLEIRKLQATIAQLESDRVLREEALHTCRSSLNELTEQLRVVQLELQNVKDANVVQREQFRRERVDLHDRLAECTDSKEELERELELMKKSTENKLHVCTTSERALQCEVADLKNDLAQLQIEHDKLQHVKQTVYALAERLQNNVSSQENHIHELEQELTNAVKEKNNYASQLRELQRKMESVTNEFTEQLNDERERATLEKERWLHQYKFAIEKEQSLLAEARAGREMALLRLTSAQNDLQSNEEKIKRMQQEWRHALRSEQELQQWLNMIEQFAMQAANEIGYECIPPLPLQSSRVENLSHEQEIESEVEFEHLKINNKSFDGNNNKTPANKERQLMVVQNTCPFTIDVGAVFEALLDRLQIFTLSAHSLEVEDRQLDELHSALTQLQTHVDDMDVMCSNVNSSSYSNNNTPTSSKSHNTHELFAESELQVLSEEEEEYQHEEEEGEEEEEESFPGLMQNKMSNTDNRRNVSSHLQTPQLPHPHQYNHHHQHVQYNKWLSSNNNNTRHGISAHHHQSDMHTMLLSISHVQFLQFIVTSARTYIHRVLDHIHTMEEELRMVVFAMGMHHLSNTVITNTTTNNTSKGNKHNTNNNKKYEIKSALTINSLVTRQRLQVTSTIAFLHKRTAQLTRLIQRIMQYYSNALTSEYQEQEQEHLQGRKKNMMSRNNNRANYETNPSATPSSTSVRSSAASSTTETSYYNTSTQHKQKLEQEQEREEEWEMSENDRHIPLRRKLGHLMMKASTPSSSAVVKPYLTNETSHSGNNNSKTSNSKINNSVNLNRETILKKWTSLLQATWQVFAEAERLALRPYNELLVDCVTTSKTQTEEIRKQRSKPNTFVQNEKVVDNSNTQHVVKLDEERERQYHDNAEIKNYEEHHLDNNYKSNEERNNKY